MKRPLYILAIVLCYSLTTYGQNWIKTYCDTGGYSGVFALETYDKGFLVTGASTGSHENAVIYKTDVNGNVLWQRYIGVHDGNAKIERMCSSPDGGNAIIGEITEQGINSYVFVSKLDACGETEWTRTYKGENQPLHTNNICLMKDGGYVFNLEENLEGYMVMNAGWVYRIDKKGNTIWSTEPKNQALNVSLADSDNILVTGYSFYEEPHGGTPIPQTTVYATKVDSNANYLAQGRYEDNVNTGIQTLNGSSGNFITLAHDIFGSEFIALFQWNSNGSLLKRVLIQDTFFNNIPLDFTAMQNGTYYVLGEKVYLNNDSAKAEIFHISPALAILKDTLYQNAVFSSNQVSINSTSDNKIIVTGSTKSGKGPAKISLAKINAGMSFDSFYSAKHTYDFMCGNPINPTENIWLDTSKKVILGINNTMQSEPSFTVYPNPANGFAYLNAVGLENSPIQFILYNMLGSRIKAYNLSPDETGQLNQKIDMQGLHPGYYIIEINQGSQIFRQKLVVN